MKPLYPSQDYGEFVANEKRKGLLKKYWKDLPEMWEEEQMFRASFEGSLNKLGDKVKPL